MRIGLLLTLLGLALSCAQCRQLDVVANVHEDGARFGIAGAQPSAADDAGVDELDGSSDSPVSERR